MPCGLLRIVTGQRRTVGSSLHATLRLPGAGGHDRGRGGGTFVGADRVTFRAVFAVREFRAMWAAEALSQAGDQLARVALAVLVYGRTESAALAGLTYALTLAPAFLGGIFLSGLADRFPRRDVMVITDVLRAALIGLVAVPGI